MTASGPPPPRGFGFGNAAAFAVHVFTASGAALGLLALLAAVERDYVAMFAWLAVALAVDGIDGTFARLLHVRARLPRWSGDTLDLVVDFVTYVFVPAYVIATAGLMPKTIAVGLALAIVVSSALYFADGAMKLRDNFFRGFPALWNAIAFYLLVLRPPAMLAALLILALIVLTFAPLRFVHPFRVIRLRKVTLVVLLVWAGCGILALFAELDPHPALKALLLLCGLYFFGIGFLPTRGSAR